MTSSAADHKADHSPLCCLHRDQKFRVVIVLAVLMILTLAFNLSRFTVGELQARQVVNDIRPTSAQIKLYKQSVNNTDEQTDVDLDLEQRVRKIRILCLIMTMEKSLSTKVDAVNKTWAKRCHKHFYVIYSNQTRHDFLNVDVPDKRRLLIEKMKKSFKFVYDHLMGDFDYVLKADDDTYVIVENLQYLLSNYPSNEPGYLGFHFDKFVKSGYMSGGAGYVITNSGLRHLFERGFDKGTCPIIPRNEDKENSEDIEIGRCLETAGVPRLSSIDMEGRETFHTHTLHQHLFKGVPGYVYSWAKNKVGEGKECCSRYSISFHYMTPDAILYTDHILYDTSVFGVSDSQRRNKQNVFRTGKVFK